MGNKKTLNKNAAGLKLNWRIRYRDAYQTNIHNCLQSHQKSSIKVGLCTNLLTHRQRDQQFNCICARVHRITSCYPKTEQHRSLSSCSSISMDYTCIECALTYLQFSPVLHQWPSLAESFHTLKKRKDKFPLRAGYYTVTILYLYTICGVSIQATYMI